MWKELCSSFWSLSRSESRGLTALSVIALISGLASYYIPMRISEQEIRKMDALLAELLESAAQGLADGGDPADAAAHYTETSPGAEISPTSRTDRGREFRNAEVEFESRVIRKERAGPSARPVAAVPERPLTAVPVNSVTAKELMRGGLLPPELAFRTVRFREMLGGFHRPDQVADVYGMNDTVFRRIRDLLVLDPVSLPAIPVNSATAEQLQENPYISSGLARQMVNFRDKVHPFRSREDLLKLYFMDEALLEKLWPYLTLD